MRVAIVHYHLRPGGVTNVIENAVACLNESEVKAVVLTGEPYTGSRLSCAHTVEGLGYGDLSKVVQPRHLAGQMIKIARKAFGGNEPDIWHIHNHSLGKNTALPEALSIMLRDNQRMLFQIHDFAEDGRPGNYQKIVKACGEKRPGGLAATLYPIAPQLHYAVLNRRDFGILQKTGAPDTQLHLLPNPISALEQETVQQKCIQNLNTERLFLYPTRGIRRKNIGEFILWSALTDDDTLFATTRAPKNPQWQPIHDRWTALSGQLGLPVKFAITETTGNTLPSLVQAAHTLVTTSIAEGFGLAFLEPFATGKPLAGRNLPDITSDFTANGINLDSLYNKLFVPLDIIGEKHLRKALSKSLKQYYQTYGRKMLPQAIERAFNATLDNGRVDFGCLDESMQETVIKRVAESLTLRSEIIPNQLKCDDDSSTLTRNRELIAKHYSLSSYSRKLIHIYRTIVGATAGKPDNLNAGKLLDCFLSPERFRLLRS